MMSARVAGVVLLAAIVAASSVAAQLPPPPDTARLADTTVRADTALLAAQARLDTGIAPQLDQGRGVDAEIRSALFELLTDRWVPALDRMQWLHTSPVAFTDVQAVPELRDRRDLLFLLSQAYYRLGLSEPFRGIAQPLLESDPTARYGTLVQSQLLMDAYQRGEFERAVAMARAMAVETAPQAVRGLALLVTGLSAYELRDYVSARQAFAEAGRTGTPYADAAQYMEALTLLRSDTAQIGPALASMQALAQRATGPLGDQVRLTAAQLAYEAEQFDESARMAGAIGPASPLAPQAIFTRAWALYHAERLQDAADAFSEFARRFPQLPQHEESRLMAAQALLELERTADAGAMFQEVADSANRQVEALRTRRPEITAELARRLVDGRAAGLLFIADPTTGKTLVLEDADGLDWSVLAGALTDTAALLPRAVPPRVVALDAVEARVDSVLGFAESTAPPARPLDAPVDAPVSYALPVSSETLPRRLFFTPVSASPNRAAFARTAHSVYESDVAVALASYRLADARAAQARQVALLEALRNSLTDAELEQMLARLSAARDSIEAIASDLDRNADWVRRMFAAQLEFTRTLAGENRRMVDSVRTHLAGTLEPSEASALEYEAQTASTYQRIADLIEAALEGAIARHPAFAMRDSTRAHAARIAALVDETRSALGSALAAIDDELGRLRAGDSDRVLAMRAALSEADQRRAAAEAQLASVVRAELDARADEVIALLRRDTEAAEFGAASAAFFQALEAQRAIGTDHGSTSNGVLPQYRNGGAPARTPPRED
ncbi:MAG TPA: hypothetical protein VMM18_06085 [Gemmatimonadaceae bacterium]|nr:hypothetical protein [Gemmatimonadaceae bacterium]